jgi:hypothetical protein
MDGSLQEPQEFELEIYTWGSCAKVNLIER